MVSLIACHRPKDWLILHWRISSSRLLNCLLTVSHRPYRLQLSPTDALDSVISCILTFFAFLWYTEQTSSSSFSSSSTVYTVTQLLLSLIICLKRVRVSCTEAWILPREEKSLQCIRQLWIQAIKLIVTVLTLGKSAAFPPFAYQHYRWLTCSLFTILLTIPHSPSTPSGKTPKDSKQSTSSISSNITVNDNGFFDSNMYLGPTSSLGSCTLRQNDLNSLINSTSSTLTMTSLVGRAVIRARLPNDQRTTVQIHPGQTLRDALEKACARRQLNMDSCYVQNVQTGEFVEWDVDASLFEDQDIEVLPIDPFSLRSRVSHSFVVCNLLDVQMFANLTNIL